MAGPPDAHCAPLDNHEEMHIFFCPRFRQHRTGIKDCAQLMRTSGPRRLPAAAWGEFVATIDSGQGFGACEVAGETAS